MSKRKWEPVETINGFNEGWEVKYVHRVDDHDRGINEITTGRFTEPFKSDPGSDKVNDLVTFSSFDWFQRPPKAMKEPTALHSMVQVGKRQWIRVNTVDSYCPWLEITSESNKVIRNNESRCVWSSITDKGTPTPYTPEATNE